MAKSWKKISNGNYVFTINNQELARFEIAMGTTERKAVATIGDASFLFEKIGFWKNNIEISSAQGEVLAKVYPKKWYANTLILAYNQQEYDLIIRNNPLAEWAILAQGREILAYGLHPNNGKVEISIKSIDEQVDVLLECLLWYLFLPIATENSGDTFLFSLLLAAQ